MRIDPKIAALRSDKASQRRVREAMTRAKAAWLADKRVAPLKQEFERFAEGEDLGSLPSLARLCRDLGAAREFVGLWQSAMIAVLADEPMAQVPFRHRSSAGYQVMQLFHARGAALSLMVYEERPKPITPRSASFADFLQFELALGGQARALAHELHRNEDGLVSIRNQALTLTPGSRLVIEGAHQTRQIIEAHGQFALLQLSRAHPDPAPTREYDIETAKLLHQSSGDKRASQIEMAIAVLGAMERSDAVAAISDCAWDGPAHLRWEAVRHTLALDARAGIALLTAIAARGQDELQAQAASLLARLRRDHSALFETADGNADDNAKDKAPCPA